VADFTKKWNFWPFGGPRSHQ